MNYIWFGQKKTFMLYDAYKSNPFNSNYFIWTDIGIIRSISQLNDLLLYPNNNKIIDVFDENKIIMSCVKPFKKDEFIYQWQNFIM